MWIERCYRKHDELTGRASVMDRWPGIQEDPQARIFISPGKLKLEWWHVTPGMASQLLAGGDFALLRSTSGGRSLPFVELRVRFLNSPPPSHPGCVPGPLPYAPEPVLTRPPHPVIEVVSPYDAFPDTLAKFAKYLKAGAPHIWVPDPYKRTLHIADPEGMRLSPQLIAETELVGIVNFNERFAELNTLER